MRVKSMYFLPLLALVTIGGGQEAQQQAQQAEQSEAKPPRRPQQVFGPEEEEPPGDDQPGDDQPPQVTRIPAAPEAVAVAWEDAARISELAPDVLPFIRYVFDNWPSDRSRWASGYATNTALNFAGDPYKPAEILLQVDELAPRVWRVRLDLHGRRDAEIIEKLRETWDKQTDAQFYLPDDSLAVGQQIKGTAARTITETIRTEIATANSDQTLKVGSDEARDATGLAVVFRAGTTAPAGSLRTITTEGQAIDWRHVTVDGVRGWVREDQIKVRTEEKTSQRAAATPEPKIDDSKTLAEIALPAAYADYNSQLTELIAMTECTTPIVSWGQFLLFGLSTVEPGLYYEFQQFEDGAEGRTDEEEFLLRVGVNLNEIGDRNVDQRLVQIRTPTGTWGQIEYLFTNSTRATLGPGFTAITRDYFAGQVKADRHALENLDKRKHDGTEIIGLRQDGGALVILTDGDGNRVDEAPGKLAADRTVPEPFLPRLQGAIGCIRCHADSGFWLPAHNYVTWLRKVKVGKKRFDVFGDIAGSELALGETLQRLVDLYNGDPDEPFALARQTHSKFTIKATYLPREAIIAGKSTETACKAVGDEYNHYHHRYWTTRDVCRLLGYDVPEGIEAAHVFNQLCPPAVTEPLRITALRGESKDDEGKPNPMKLTSDDIQQIFPEIATRAYNELQQQQSQEPQQELMP